MKKLLQYLTLTAAAIGLACTVHALPTLNIYTSLDGTTWTLAASDQVAPGDVNPVVGAVTYIGTLPGWTTTVDTGMSYPLMGNLTNPRMDLHFNALSSGAGNLWLAFSADSFGPTLGTPVVHIGGTIDPAPSSPTPVSSVTYTTFMGATINAQTTQLTNQGPFTSPSFAADAIGTPINAVGPYSLTQVVHIYANAAGVNVTGDATLSVPDAGTTVLLLGAGLTALGIFARRQRRLV